MPFQISCGHCFMCDQHLYTQCETTQVREEGMGAALFGFSKLYGAVPGGQAEYLRVPQAQNTTIKVPEGPPDERFVYLSDVLPTAWQAVEYAAIPDGGTRRRARPRPDRRHGLPHRRSTAGTASSASTWCPSGSSASAAAASRSSTCSDHEDDLGDVIREMTDGRGPDSVIDAVGMEAHGSPVGQARPQDWPGCCPTSSPRRSCRRRASTA